MSIRFLCVLLAGFILPACQSLNAEAGDILFVDNKQVDCEGVAPQKCMLVKQPGDDKYLYFYDQIEGFDYEPGYRYKLSVKITELENVPADASSLHYKLIEVLEKTPAPN